MADLDGGPPAEPIDTNFYNRLVSNELTELNLNQTVESVLREHGYESPDEDADADEDEEDEQNEEEREAAREQRRQLRRENFAQHQMRPLVNAIIRGLPQNTVIRKLSIRSAFLLLIPNDMWGRFLRALSHLSALEHFQVYYEKGDRGFALPVSDITAVVGNARGLKSLDVVYPWFSSQSEVVHFALVLDTQADSLVVFNLNGIYFDEGDTVPEGFSMGPILRSLSNMPSLCNVGYNFSLTAIKALNGRNCCSDDAFAALCSLSSLEELRAQLFSFHASHRATLVRLLESSTLKHLFINAGPREGYVKAGAYFQVGEADEQALLNSLERNYNITQATLGIVSDGAQEKINTLVRLNGAGRGELLTTDRYKSKEEWINFFVKISDHPIDDIIYMLKLNPNIWARSDTVDQRAPTDHETAAVAREERFGESGPEALEAEPGHAAKESRKRAADTGEGTMNAPKKGRRDSV